MELSQTDILNGAPASYRRDFSPQDVDSHLRAIASLETRPYVLWVSTEGTTAKVTIVSRDRPGLFSMITGLLGAGGMSIHGGQVYTLDLDSIRLSSNSSREDSGEEAEDGSESGPREGSILAHPLRAFARRRFKPRAGRFAGMPGSTIAPRHRTPGVSGKPGGGIGRSGVSGRPGGGEVSGKIIVDRFIGTADVEPETLETHLQKSFERLFTLIESQGFEAGRRMVAEAVADRVAGLTPSEGVAVAPITITEDLDTENVTRFTVRTKDTPFFLYSLSNALSLHNISIQRVEIETEAQEIRDTFEIAAVNAAGGTSPVRDRTRLDRIRLSILLTKQFTFVLDRAPNPYEAMKRFDRLIQDLGESPDSEDLMRLFSDRELQSELAVLLGASDFVWEDFVRRQREQLLPMLSKIEHHQLLSYNESEMEERLREAIHNGSPSDSTDPIDRLNEFKDRQSFLIDLDHMLASDVDFFFLSRRLTALAEAVVRAALTFAWEDTTARYGIPRTAAGIPASYAAFGLGKLGGSALGYASDIELLFIYNDSGETDGSAPEPDGSDRGDNDGETGGGGASSVPGNTAGGSATTGSVPGNTAGGSTTAGSVPAARSVSNSEFFEQLFRTATRYIRARREGIFQTDLRLRPHGEDGPLAAKLERFVEYYSAGGPAHAAERLALVRLRQIGGDSALGQRVVRIRDEILYQQDSVDIPAVRELRRTQLSEKLEPDRLNAKFSPGGLVDLEYNVQILQITHGRANPALRCPGIHDALEALREEGTTGDEETEAMIAAYRFLRRLINGLRMLRGNAMDLFMPPFDSSEAAHLARRIGYARGGELSETDALKVDFQTHTAVVRGFVERHLGADAIPGEVEGGPADLVLSPTLTDARRDAILARVGVRDPVRAAANIQAILSHSNDAPRFSRVLVLAWDPLANVADADMALNNWERFARACPSGSGHLVDILEQPQRLDILFTIFSASQFLSEILASEPDIFAWITTRTTVERKFTDSELAAELQREWYSVAAGDRTLWLSVLRRFRKRHILRIGTRDICLGESLPVITAEIASLARAIVHVSLQAVWCRTLDRLPAIATGAPGDEDVPSGDGAPAGTSSGESTDGDGAPAAETTPGAGARGPGSAGETTRGDGAAAGEASDGRATNAQASPDEQLDLEMPQQTWRPAPAAAGARRLAVFAFGKLGGRELNYSSDIDLLAVYTPSNGEGELKTYTDVVRGLISDLTEFTADGQCYRVDMRLRPHGISGALVLPADRAIEYYERDAGLWEKQALLKLSPVAGDPGLGRAFMQRLKTLFRTPVSADEATASVAHLRSLAVAQSGESSIMQSLAATSSKPRPGEPQLPAAGTDIKNGEGGIRDIEFAVQVLQLMHAHSHPEVLTGNTLEAIGRLEQAGILTHERASELTESYTLLRKIEHFLQLYGDRQLHTIPTDAGARERLAATVAGAGASTIAGGANVVGGGARGEGAGADTSARGENAGAETRTRGANARAPGKAAARADTSARGENAGADPVATRRDSTSFYEFLVETMRRTRTFYRATVENEH